MAGEKSIDNSGDHILSVEAPSNQYGACNISVPELWATEVMEKTSSEYLHLLGSMSMEAVKFATSLQDNAAAAGYKDLHKHMDLAFEIPDKVSLGLKPFPAQWAWRIASTESTTAWGFGSDRPLAHAELGQLRSKSLAVTKHGEMALILNKGGGFAPKKYQWRARHESLGVDGWRYRWDPPMLKRLIDGDATLLQYAVSSESVDSEAKRQEVLEKWRGLLKGTYDRQIEVIESDIKRQPFQI